MVCAGVHKVTGEVVAVKQIPRRLMSTPRLQAEVDLLRMAGQHKNVVGFRDLFSDGNFYYIVMGKLFSRFAKELWRSCYHICGGPICVPSKLFFFRIWMLVHRFVLLPAIGN